MVLGIIIRQLYTGSHE